MSRQVEFGAATRSKLEEQRRFRVEKRKAEKIMKSVVSAFDEGSSSKARKGALKRLGEDEVPSASQIMRRVESTAPSAAVANGSRTGTMELARVTYEVSKQMLGENAPVQRLLYSQLEKENALLLSVTQKMKDAAISRKFGVPDRTLRSWKVFVQTELGMDGVDKKAFKSFCKDEENYERISSTIATMEFPKVGKTGFFSCVEKDMLALTMDMRGEAASSLSRLQVGSNCREALKVKAEKLIEANGGVATEEAEKLLNAKCGREFVARNFSAEDSLHVGEGDGRFTKNSQVSLKRAKAANPENAHQLFLQINKQQCDLHALGEFDIIEGPQAEDWLDLDEIGFSVEGHAYAGFRIRQSQKNGDRRMVTRTSEHNAFWVSVILVALCRGALLTPVIIHKGGTDTEFQASFAIGLDPTFIVTANQSGYCDTNAYKLVVAEIIRKWSSRAEGHQRHKFAAQDGWYAHFDPESLQALINEKIHPIFLVSNNSINDAPLDMGINAFIVGYYNREYNDWRMKNPNEPFTPTCWNRVFTASWHKANADPRYTLYIFYYACNHSIIKEKQIFTFLLLARLPGIIQRAFAKAHLFPLTDPYAFTPGKNTDSTSTKKHAMSSKISKCTALAQTMCSDPAVAQHLRTTKAAIEGHKKVIFSIPDLAEPDKIKVTLAQPSSRPPSVPAVPGSKEYHVIMSSAAYQFHNTSFLTPAAENARLREEEKRAKGVRLKKNDSNALKRLDTSQGLCIVQSHLEEMRKIEAKKKADTAAKKQREHDARLKLAESRMEQARLAEQLLAAFWWSEDGEAWKRMTVKHMKAAYQKYCAAERQGAMPQAKKDLVPVISEALEKLQPPPVRDYASESSDDEDEMEAEDEDDGDMAGDEPNAEANNQSNDQLDTTAEEDGDEDDDASSMASSSDGRIMPGSHGGSDEEEGEEEEDADGDSNDGNSDGESL